MDAHKNVFMWGLFLTSSMIAAIHLGPDSFMNSEIYKNTKFENIGNVFNITQKWIKEYSEEIQNAKCLEYSSLSWARSVLANDQAMKCANAKACVYADSVLCIGRMEQAPGAAGRRWKGQDKLKTSGSIPRTKMQLDSTEKQLNSSEIFPRIFDIDSSQGDPDGLGGGEEHPTRELQGQDHLHVYVQRPSVESR